MGQPSRIMIILEQSREAAQKITECMAKLEHVTSQNLSGMPHGNPIEQIEVWIEAFSELEASRELTRGATDLISGIASSLGPKFADPLYLYYVEAVPTWKMVANKLGITKRMVFNRKCVAIDWAESVGYEIACKGVDDLEIGEITNCE